MDVGERMARIKGKDTKPEMLLRRALWAAGVRYRVQVRLPGKPDIAFLKAKVIVFVDGCFWHSCPTHFRAPKTNSVFWAGKIRGNQERDRRVDASLEALGYVIIRLWEHEILEDPKGCAQRVIGFLTK